MVPSSNTPGVVRAVRRFLCPLTSSGKLHAYNFSSADMDAPKQSRGGCVKESAILDTGTPFQELGATVSVHIMIQEKNVTKVACTRVLGPAPGFNPARFH